MKTTWISALAGAAALAMSAPASAATLDIFGTLSNGGSGGPSFYTDDISFLLPVGFTNASLTISFFEADDRAVAQLNGTTVDATGINCCGDSPGFDFNDGFGTVPFTYTNYNGPRNIVVTSGFLTGSNTLHVIVNDTYTGVNGTLTNGPGGPAGPTGYTLLGQVSYDVDAVPEPATWGLMIMGFGAAGAMLRRRRVATAAI